MTGPMLPLDATDLSSRTNSGIVAAWMLFPDDEDQRNRIILHAAVREGQEKLQSGQLQQHETEALVEMALHAASPEECAKAMEERAPRGFGAGMIVYNACIRIPRGDKAPMTGSMKEVELSLWQKTSSASKHINDVVWKTFRPVAALWAAYIYCEPDGDDPAVPFPCERWKLAEYLAIAEAFRIRAETTKPPHRKATILQAVESVVLPPDVLSALPDGELVILQK